MWVVAKARGGKEAWAGENIKRQSAEPYLPKFREIVVKRGRKLEVDRLLFPRYVFVFCPNGQWRFLLGTFGVTGIIPGSGGFPATVPEREIKNLKSRENNQGYVELPEAPKGAFIYGQEVGYEMAGIDCVGIYQGMPAEGRARVLMDVLGRKTTVLVDESKLRAA